ncbi:Spliceosome-associated protein 49 [Podospora pseudopauciseta]|uniref:Spliceosome-associated protein 49 n=2 Tax=Podospora TaxID=5144 RepID=A0ABR0HR61_9PEZI|nr:Spliceosome-associated protein 49 [Podospora pseudopauciseta]KAK4680191.1 Spliceosome-associated protein 49 [Podospora pseudoanserina]
MSKHWEQNKDATVYVGNIDERFTQELLTELMTQVGPVRQVHMPLDRVTRNHQGYGFIEFDTPESAEYAAKCLNGVRVHGKPLRVNKASADKQKTVDIGAELFINNLDPQVDEKILYDTFSTFGQILRQPNIVRDDNNISKGYGFVSFDSFEASDAALANMNGQYLLSKAISVDYAYKKDGKGERHGDEAERRLAAEGKKHNIVPEQQVLPPAFHMNAPIAATTPVTPVAAVPPMIDPSMAAIPPPVGMVPPVVPPLGPGGMPPVPVAAYGGPLPTGPAAMGGRGGPPPIPYGGGMPPAMPSGGGGRMSNLPPPPSGLPARPPPSQAGFGGPVPFHPPPGFAPSPPVGPGQQMYPPPVGFNGPPPPQGFMPPPGGAPPPGFGGPPPNGYPRRG